MSVDYALYSEATPAPKPMRGVSGDAGGGTVLLFGPAYARKYSLVRQNVAMSGATDLRQPPGAPDVADGLLAAIAALQFDLASGISGSRVIDLDELAGLVDDDPEWTALAMRNWDE